MAVSSGVSMSVPFVIGSLIDSIYGASGATNPVLSLMDAIAAASGADSAAAIEPSSTDFKPVAAAIEPSAADQGCKLLSEMLLLAAPTRLAEYSHTSGKDRTVSHGTPQI